MEGGPNPTGFGMPNHMMGGMSNPFAPNPMSSGSLNSPFGMPSTMPNFEKPNSFTSPSPNSDNKNPFGNMSIDEMMKDIDRKLKELDDIEKDQKEKLKEKNKEITNGDIDLSEDIKLPDFDDLPSSESFSLIDDKEKDDKLEEKEEKEDSTSKPKVNIDVDSVIVNENVITDDEFFDDFFDEDE